MSASVDVILDAEEVVAVLELAVVGVERPAADSAALGDDDALGAATFGHRNLGGDRMGLVLQREHAPLAHPHAGEQQLRVAADELRPSGDVGVDPLEAAIVERHDVVLHRLDQPEPLQLGQLLRILGDNVLGLRPVVGAVELPDVVSNGGG